MLARTAQARVGLELIYDRAEVVEADDAFELEARAIVAHPDHISLDPAHHGQADDDAIAAIELDRVVDHKAVRRQVADVQMQVAMHEMLDNRRKINRVPRRATQIGYAEISSTRHVFAILPFIWGLMEGMP